MAAVFLKHLKFPRLFRISFNINHLNTLNSPSVLLRRQLHNDRISYATAAAAKNISNEDRFKESKYRLPEQATSDENINYVLDAIDNTVKRTGRILSKHVSNALSVVSCTKDQVTPVHGLYLLRSCKYIHDISPKERLQLVNNIWNKFQELGVKFDVQHYNALLNIHIKNGYDFNPAEILSSIEDQGLEANTTTYLLLLQKYCKDGNLVGAGEILEFIKEKGFSANEEVFNCLIEGHLKNDDIPGALDILEVMRSSNLEPNSNTYTILACGYANKGEFDKMLSCLNQKQITFSVENYLQVVKALAVSGHFQHIDQVFSMINNPEEHQQEFINASLELVHMDLVDLAYKLILLVSSPSYNQGVKILIKQLIKSEKPIPQVINICNDIMNKGLHVLIFNIAVRTAAEYGKLDYAFGFLEEMLKQGHSVRLGNFLQIIQLLKGDNIEQNIWSILKKASELGIPADFTSYLDFVLPALGVPNPSDFISKVKETGQGVNPAADALFLHYCYLGEIDRALELTKLFPVVISSKVDIRNFLEKFNAVKKSASYSGENICKVLFYMLNNIDRSDANVVRGRILADLIMNEPKMFQALLRNLENSGDTLKLNDEVLSTCYHLINQKDPTSMLLFSKLRNKKDHYKEDMTFEEEIKELKHLEEQGLMFKPFLLDRLAYHAQHKDIERFKKLEDIFITYGFTYTPLLLSQLMAMYSNLGDLTKAEEVLQKLKETYPTFKLDVFRVIELATVYIKYMKYGEATEALKSYLTKPYLYASKRHITLIMKRFFNIVCDTGNVELMKNIHSCMLPLAEEVGAKKQLLELNVSIHLHKDDLASAYEEYKNCLQNHQIPVCLNALLKKCITSGENDILQSVVDTTNHFIGNKFTSIELAFAFIELGRYAQADKVIKSLGDHADTKCVYDMADKLSSQRKVLDLERFIELVKPFVNVDREKLYQVLFKTLDDVNDYKRALEIFNKLKKEEIEPCKETYQILTNILKKNNQLIPFEFQSENTSDTAVETESLEYHAKYTETFINCLREKDIESAIKEIKNMKKGYVRTLPFHHLTDFVQLCMEHNRINDISINPFVMPYIVENAREIIKPLLEKYSSLGDVKSVTSITSFMPDFSLKEISFNLHFCKAYMNSGRHEDLLSELEKSCEKRNKLFSATVFEELLTMPEIENKIHDLAVQYYNNNFDLPIGVVWTHYFLNEDYDKAKEIFKVFPFSLERLDSKILRSIRESKNVDLGKEYLKVVNESICKQRVKERAYGTVVDVLVSKNMHDEAANLVVEAQNLQLELDKHYPSTLNTLKSALERENKPVPFNIQTEEFSSEKESLSQ